MIQLAIALLVGFLIGWLFLLKREFNFSPYTAVIMFALLESISYSWYNWLKQRFEAEYRSLNRILFWRFVVALVYGYVVLSFGEAINEDFKLIALLPIATVFLINLYKIVSFSEK